MQQEWSSEKIYTKAQKKENCVQIRRESKNNGTESIEVNPQEQDQSNNIPINEAMSWPNAPNMTLF